MRPLAFNLSGSKKIASDKGSSTFQLKNGHQIKVAHAALSPEHRKMIEKLPIHLADGGDLNSGDSNGADQTPPTQAGPVDTSDRVYANPADDPNTPVVAQSNQTGGASADWGAPADAPADAALPPVDPNLPGAGAPVGPANVVPTTGTAPLPTGSGVDVNQAYNQGQKAITEQQDVATQLAKNQAQIQQADIENRQDLNNTFQKNTQDFQAQQKQFMLDYMNNHIDPNHYMENMSSGQKVATGIGLFLGGFSSAFTHQGNPAMDFLNKQIDRDIAGQESRLGQQKTILGANQELYHDQVLANNATRINMNDIYDHKIALAASQLGTPAAKAQADAAHSKFALENAALLQQNAIRATTLQAMRNGGAGLDAIAIGNAGFMSPEQAQKEQSSIDRQKQSINNINTLYDQANKEASVWSVLNPQSYKRMDTINAGIRDAILSTDVNHRVSPEVLNKMIDPFLVNTTDTTESAALKQHNALAKIQELTAGETPITSRLAPAALPQYGLAQAPQQSYKVGDVAYVKGQKVQIINSKGDYKAVK